MAPTSVVNHNNSEEDVLDAEIMKAIRNSLKELNIQSPSRPSRPAPGALAQDDENEEDFIEVNCSDDADLTPEDDDPVSMVTKASEIERELQESLKEVLIIKDNEEEEEANDEEEIENEDNDEDVVECSRSSSVIHRKKKTKRGLYKAQLKQAINASLADINSVTSGSRQSTPSRPVPRPLTPTPPPITKIPLSHEERKDQYRPLIIDGSSMGFAYGNHDRFCAEGIRAAYECFKTLGFEDDNIVIILKHIPQHYKAGHDQAIIDFYHKMGILHYCPSRYAGDVLIKSNDDLFILKTASELEGVVLSCERFREYWDLYPEYRDVIMYRLIQPTFIKDQLILPLDPLGVQGPELDQVLRFTD